MRLTPSVDRRLRRAQAAALMLGAALFVAGTVALRWHPTLFFRGYLLGFMFWIGIGLGSLGVLLLHALVGGGWGRAVRGPLASAVGTLPAMAILFIPILLGLRSLYPWAFPDAGLDEILVHKRPYLNPTFFVIRAGVFLLLWAAMSVAMLRRLGREEPPGEDGRGTRIASGIGLVLYVLTVSFAAIDWMMSLEPHWFSAGYGLFLIAGQGLASLALGITAVAALLKSDPGVPESSPAVLRDLGNLLLAFLMIWGYLAFSQYLIIWAGDIPEEATWYLHRLEGGWQVVAALLLLVHFGIPFLLLLSVRAKRDPRVLGGVAVLLLVMRALETYWLVVPAFSPGELDLHWLDATGLLGIGGLWISLWIRSFRAGGSELSSWPAAGERAHA